MSGITGKVVVVTGASSGIGYWTGKGFAEAGAKVMLAARRGDRLAELEKEIRDAGGQVETMVTDVAKQADMERLAEATLSAFGRADVLVNNAGVMTIAALADGKVEDWNAMIDINIKGVLYGIAAFLPIMRRQKSGHVVNVTSTNSHKVAPGGTVYAATKFALWAITDGLRMEVSPDIRVTAISPGAVTSELHTNADAILYAVGQPADVGINEIVLRPATQVA
jgi:NADP-dependent 3-hydroxy acid dehydrogenase YdfG